VGRAEVGSCANHSSIVEVLVVGSSSSSSSFLGTLYVESESLDYITPTYYLSFG